MEVHHHPIATGLHAERKRLKHYLFEFFMLFLAVFCGFLAENQREHIVDNQREKKYAASLLDDLKKDTADLSNDIPFWKTLLNTIDTLRTEIQKPADQRNDLLLYKCARFMRFYNNFAYHDRTIDQLKNAGNFRLIRNARISDLLIDYDATIRSELHDQEMQSNAIWQNLNFLQDHLFNSAFYNLYTYNDTKQLDSAARSKSILEMLRIRKGKDDDLFEYFNHLEYYHQINKYRYHTNQNLLYRADTLIDLIQKKYDLK